MKFNLFVISANKLRKKEFSSTEIKEVYSQFFVDTYAYRLRESLG
jgi:hypothetical protein